MTLKARLHRWRTVIDAAPTLGAFDVNPPDGGAACALGTIARAEGMPNQTDLTTATIDWLVGESRELYKICCDVVAANDRAMPSQRKAEVLSILDKAIANAH